MGSFRRPLRVRSRVAGIGCDDRRDPCRGRSHATTCSLGVTGKGPKGNQLSALMLALGEGELRAFWWGVRGSA